MDSILSDSKSLFAVDDIGSEIQVNKDQDDFGGIVCSV